MSLVPSTTFCDDVEALGELLCIRRTTFIVGSPGSGKSARWQTLARARNNVGRFRTTVRTLLPEALGQDLFGGYRPSVDGRPEWSQGFMATLLKKALPKPTRKKLGSKSTPIVAEDPRVDCSWIILDGEMSVEQCATFATLMEHGVDFEQANGELVAISPDQSFLCECDSLDWATPGLLSKAGLMYVATTEASANAIHFLTAWGDKYEKYGEVLRESLLEDATRYVRNTFCQPLVDSYSVWTDT